MATKINEQGNLILTEEHYRVMKMMLEGDTLAMIKEKTGVWPNVLMRWKKDEGFAAEYARMKEAIFQTTKDSIACKLQQEAPTSLDKLIKLRDHANSEKVQLDATNSLLDRAGFAPVNKTLTGVAIALPPELTQLIAHIIKEEEVGAKHLAGRKDQAVLETEVPGQSLLLP